MYMMKYFDDFFSFVSLMNKKIQVFLVLKELYTHFLKFCFCFGSAYFHDFYHLNPFKK